MIQTPCVIFAGGKSSRMEEDKSLLPFGSYPTLVQYQHARLSKIFSKVYISSKDRSKFDFDAHFIEDKPSYNVFAPTVGFVSIFETLSVEKLFIISVDSPFVTQKEIKQLFIEDKNSYDATIAKTEDGIQPLCGIYHRSMLPYFYNMLQSDTHKLTKTLYEANTKFVFFDDKQPFLNLNYPHEYQEALKLLNTLL